MYFVSHMNKVCANMLRNNPHYACAFKPPCPPALLYCDVDIKALF